MKLENEYIRHGLRVLFDLAFGKSVGKSLNLFCFNQIVDPIPDPNLVFIFQGPIISSSDLYSGLTAYRQSFPRAQIILSTWNSNELDGDYLKSINVNTVFPRPPAILGVLGVNRQIVGVSAAIDEITAERRHENVTVFKLRTDYFPRKPGDLYRLLKSLEVVFGCHRIWGVDINTKKNIPFSFSDMMNCGNYEKMRLYWEGSILNESQIDRAKFLSLTDRGESIEKILKHGTPERHLTSTYLMRLGYSFNVDSLSEYQTFLGKEFGVLDADQIGLAFNKYSVVRQGNSGLASSASDTVSFVDWVSMATCYE